MLPIKSEMLIRAFSVYELQQFLTSVYADIFSGSYPVTVEQLALGQVSPDKELVAGKMDEVMKTALYTGVYPWAWQDARSNEFPSLNVRQVWFLRYMFEFGYIPANSYAGESLVQSFAGMPDRDARDLALRIKDYIGIVRHPELQRPNYDPSVVIIGPVKMAREDYENVSNRVLTTNTPTYVETIKMVKEKYKLHLADAKRLVDAIRNGA